MKLDRYDVVDSGRGSTSSSSYAANGDSVLEYVGADIALDMVEAVAEVKIADGQPQSVHMDATEARKPRSFEVMAAEAEALRNLF